MIGRRGDELPLLPPNVDPRPEPLAVRDIGTIRRPKEQVATSTSSLDSSRQRELLIFDLQLFEGVKSFIAIDVDHDGLAGCDTDVGVGPFGPPLIYGFQFWWPLQVPPLNARLLPVYT